jgi:RsiW-degrading membrane proteinase PrsW (M82 family)
MDRLAVFAAATLPALFFLGHGIAKARADWRSEALWSAFFLGAVAAIVALVFVVPLGYLVRLVEWPVLAGGAIDAVVVAAIPEETVKFIVLVRLAERHVDVRRRQDLLVLALAVSLGFATLENLAYIAAPGDWTLIATARAITAVPGHGIFGLVMGALLIAARLRGDGPPRHLILVLATPIVLHAAYDFPLMAMTRGGDKVWLAGLWLFILAGAAIIGIVTCNRVLPAAARTDREAGADADSDIRPALLLLGGLGMIVAGPLLGVAVLVLKDIQPIWAGAALGIFPVAMGLDLILTSWNRAR